ncbi:hypothetical protein SAMN02745248_00366 [Hathewaya proteolytica DSM 3090]|uniref:Uncharacterized protein n=1 Tax=Hathewaya proteolytica DSM 3090 TaxID=1121331 RepID=A0A1M6K7Z2_9CLOT|nr:hypothetical protein [Hathewaya proteolytica]SHJ55013.1 hypothetical protein SAMN02745248_00366 [Hathewaya proteolytica DSM 3090]
MDETAAVKRKKTKIKKTIRNIIIFLLSIGIIILSLFYVSYKIDKKNNIDELKAMKFNGGIIKGTLEENFNTCLKNITWDYERKNEKNMVSVQGEYKHGTKKIQVEVEFQVMGGNTAKVVNVYADGKRDFEIWPQIVESMEYKQ